MYFQKRSGLQTVNNKGFRVKKGGFRGIFKVIRLDARRKTKVFAKNEILTNHLHNFVEAHR